MRKRKRIYLALLAFSVAVVLGSGLTALAGSAYAEPQAASPRPRLPGMWSPVEAQA